MMLLFTPKISDKIDYAIADAARYAILIFLLITPRQRCCRAAADADDADVYADAFARCRRRMPFRCSMLLIC